MGKVRICTLLFPITKRRLAVKTGRFYFKRPIEGLAGEQSTMSMGKGRDINIKDLVRLGLEARLFKEFLESFF